MDNNSFSLEKYSKLFIKDWKIIVYFMAGMLLFTIVFGLFMFKPSYQSKAKILIKNKPQVSFVTELNSESIAPLAQNDNPVLSQIEVFSSDDVLNLALNKIAKEPDFQQYPLNQLKKSLKRSVKLKNQAGTDVINITFNWENPDDAQKIGKYYLDAYTNYTATLNRKSVSQMKKYIKNQLTKSTTNLAKIRTQISDYRKHNQSVDIEREAGSVVDQITNIENTIADIDGQLKAAQGKCSSLTTKLGVDINKAVESAALGENANLISLQQNLNDAQQKYFALNAKYPPTNVQMKTLSENIKEIKREITNQINVTLGKKISSIDHSIIFDSVRMKMVSDLVDSKTNIIALNMQKGSLLATLTTLKTKQSVIPEKQKTLASLLQDESTMAQVVQTLGAKLVEAQIKESEILSGVDVLDQPSMPDSESFPTLIHIFLIFEFIGMMLGISTIIGLYYVKDICEGANELEEIIKEPVFGIIPWLSDTSYKTTGVANINPASAISIAYQKITTSLKIRSYKNKAKVIAFSSAEFGKKRSVISAHVAKNIAKSNNSVVILDLDLRNGSISREFNINESLTHDITQLLVDTCACMSKDDLSNVERLVNFTIIPVEEQPNLYILPNNTNIDTPDEILDNDALELIISTLRKKFDFVIVDTPPMLAVPDCIAIAQNFDGLVLLCGIKTSRSNLRKIRKICDDNFIKIFGAIARDSTAEHDIPENQYIKQLSVNEAKEDEQVNPIDTDDSEPQNT